MTVPSWVYQQSEMTHRRQQAVRSGAPLRWRKGRRTSTEPSARRWRRWVAALGPVSGEGVGGRPTAPSR